MSSFTGLISFFSKKCRRFPRFLVYLQPNKANKPKSRHETFFLISPIISLHPSPWLFTGNRL